MTRNTIVMEKNQLISKEAQLENRVVINSHAAHNVLTDSKSRDILLANLKRKNATEQEQFYIRLLNCFLADQTKDVSLKHLYIQNVFFILLRDTTDFTLSFNAFLLQKLLSGNSTDVRLEVYLAQKPVTNFFGLVDIFCFYPEFLKDFCLRGRYDLMARLFSSAREPQNLLKFYVAAAKSNKEMGDRLVDNSIDITIQLFSQWQTKKITESAFKKMLSQINSFVNIFIRSFLLKQDPESFEKIQALFNYPRLVRELDLSMQDLAKLYHSSGTTITNEVGNLFQTHQDDITALVVPKPGIVPAKGLRANVKNGAAFVAALIPSTWQQLDPQRGWRGTLYRALIFCGRPGRWVAEKLGLLEFFANEEKKLGAFSAVFSESMRGSLADRLDNTEVERNRNRTISFDNFTYCSDGTKTELDPFPQRPQLVLSVNTCFSEDTETTLQSFPSSSLSSSASASPILSRRDRDAPPSPDPQAIAVQQNDNLSLNNEPISDEELAAYDDLGDSFSVRRMKLTRVVDEQEKQDGDSLQNAETASSTDSALQPTFSSKAVQSPGPRAVKKTQDENSGPVAGQASKQTNATAEPIQSPRGGRRPLVPLNQGSTFLNDQQTWAFSASLIKQTDPSQGQSSRTVLSPRKFSAHPVPENVVSSGQQSNTRLTYG